ncbi:hypothetical protein [Vulcanisaeta souniana]|uniref:Uncharacterized protein n=1 Tax=Vulcanisaeta souniana JCM 11219 TaxID=1293586 RepID=A0A830E5A2_9CREN|nr:hypothetical protein [Vulcanisaeta souniana]BDR91624.1 hypothetical protein Vsou_07170 [Vulcanisaeta souniana JCM 11219]GGI71820.1 hypothetical protein GCM10007112_05750 [Vulcanisaeta souniana JCM 11219]
MDNADVKKLLELRDKLDNRIRELQEELNLLNEIKNVLDNIIKSQSIVPATELVGKPQDLGRLVETREIRSRTNNELLGTVEIYEGGVSIKPIKPFSKDVTAFRRFFRDKILEGFKQEDDKLVRDGQLRREEAFNYEIKLDGDNVVNIIIRNYRNDERLREIIRAIRWTLERVLKMEGNE